MKLCVLGDFDGKSQGKAETGGVGKVGGAGGQQVDGIEWHGGAEIDLHPFRDVRDGLDGAVVPVRGALFDVFQLRAHFGNARLQGLDFGGGFGVVGGVGLVDRVRELAAFLGKHLSFSGGRRVGVHGTIGAVHTGEHSLQAVVFGLCDRIELVVVAPRALDRHAYEGVHRVHDHVVTI